MINFKKVLLTLFLTIVFIGNIKASSQNNISTTVITVTPLPSPLCYVFCTYDVAIAGVGIATYQCFAGVCNIIDFVPISGLNQEETSE